MTDAKNAAPGHSAHLLPGPHHAAKLAAMEAALEAPKRSGPATGSGMRARVLVGTAALAVSVTIPDISLGAIASPHSRIDLGEQMPPLPADVWSPAVRSGGPVLMPRIAASEIAPATAALSSRPASSEFDRVMPVSILDAGSERLDLAFAGALGGVELPGLVETVSLTPISPPPGQPPQPSPPAVVQAAEPPRVQLVTVPQVSVSLDLPAQTAPGNQFRIDAISSEVSRDASAAATNEAIEAAFAGAIDASSAVTAAIPIPPGREPGLPNPAREPAANAIAPRAPVPAASGRVAAAAELAVKTRLDARINGVLAGSVDFRQLDGTIAIRLRSVVDLMHERYSASELEYLRSGQAIDSFITLGELQAAGIPIRYDAVYDEVEFGIDYEDAPNAAKVQVQQIGAPTVGSDRVGIDQLTQPRR
ncbi:MAG: hypothetical protein ACX930_11810 [Erythrobacter sp.]